MSDSQWQSEVSFPVDRVSYSASEVVQIVFPIPAMPFFFNGKGNVCLELIL